MGRKEKGVNGWSTGDFQSSEIILYDIIMDILHDICQNAYNWSKCVELYNAESEL